jgi:hypothetical protein
VNDWRAGYGLTAVAAVSLVLVPLDLSCAILASESPMQHDSFVRMTHAANGLAWLFLALQILAGWLLVSKFKNQRPLPARLLLSIGLSLISIIVTFICGLGLSMPTEHFWDGLAWKLFS